MPDPSPFVSADTIPGMLEGWIGPIHTMTGIPMIWDGDKPFETFEQLYKLRLDTRRPEVRDHLSRVLARVLGVPVGATAPEWMYCSDRPEGPMWILAPCEPHCEEFWAGRVPSLASIPLDSIPLDSPDRDSLALAAVFRWIGEEIQAGRIEVPHA